jgi:Uma2 family endonuclease
LSAGIRVVSVIETKTEIDYPESDGLPMGETDLHQWWMIRIKDLLRQRYQGEQVYVSSNLLVYPEEGNNLRHVAPDCFVVLDCDPGFRRTYKLWEEGKAPDVVFEVTSNSTRRQDEDDKPALYAEIGVREYFLYDPTADYLDPPLQGFRFTKQRPAPIRPNAAGELVSRRLGIALRLEGSDLVMTDSKTGARLLTQAQAAEEQLRAAQDELAKLRRQLAQKPRDE